MATNAPQPEAKTEAPTPEPQNARLNFEEAKSIADWVALLNDENNSPLGEDVAAILKCLPSDSNDMPNILKLFESEELREKVIRFVNDAYFNPSEPYLEKIQRATIVLGFRTLRSLGLCAALFLYLLKNSQEDLFIKEIVLALHSAALAGIIAKRKIRSLNCEPLVTATLLYAIGKLLFMSFGGGNAKRYGELLASSTATVDDEQNIVGFLLKDLTIELGKTWFIGPTLQKAQEAAKEDDIIQIILLSRSIVENQKEGWDAEPLQDSIRQLGLFLAMPFPQAKNLVLEATLRALETCSQFSEKLMDHIELSEAAESIDTNAAQTAIDEIKLNPSRVAASIQEMSILLGNQNSPTMSDLIVVGLRGIRNSLDVDRAVFSLLSQDRLYLKGKSIDEKRNSGLLNEFKFELFAPEGWLFQSMLRDAKPAWIGSNEQKYTFKLRNPSLNKKVGKGDFLIAPFVMQGNIMGFYYADRQVSGRSLDETTFDSFKELCTTINGFLELLMMRSKQKR